MSKDIVIDVKNLSKCYHIYEKPGDRLKQILFRGRKKLYREFWAVKDVSFEIKKGETLGIVGQNGSGKSTLLQLICGTLNPTSGSVNVNGRISALLELGSGFNPDFTGKENVYLNASILGLSKEEIDARYNEMLAFADIGDFIDQPVKTYSSGMLMRLAFSVAINVDPDILVVDEALAVGDELFQRKCFSRIDSMKNKGVTVLLVSHSSASIIELCDKALLIDAGEKLLIGQPKSIVGAYQKLIYAADENKARIRDDIKLSFPFSDESLLLAEHVDSISLLKNDEKIALENTEFFDENLNSQSVIEYESKGAFIESPEILTLTGKRVNHLKQGESYFYRYKVRFTSDFKKVRFGMLIKTVSGIELGGSVTSSNSSDFILYQHANSLVQVEFKFSCKLNPGLYFLNAGVTGLDNEYETYLHRILDLCVIKVLPSTARNKSTGVVDFDCTSNIRSLNLSI